MYLWHMRGFALLMALLGIGSLHAQDSSRVQVRLEAMGSVGRLLTSGDEDVYLDSYYRTDPGGRIGGQLRYSLGPRFALGFGLSAGVRSFGSFTYELRVPAFGTEWTVATYDQRTTLTVVQVPVLVEWRPWRPVSLVGGLQLLAEVSRTTRNAQGEVREVEFNTGPLELLAGVEVRPIERIAVVLRYLHQIGPVREQQRWTPDGVVSRKTTWSTVEAGLAVMLGRP
jgi:hypothetical protein